MIKRNPDRHIYIQVTQAVRNNNGYCPCRLEKTEDTKCMCKEFKDQVTAQIEGECHCGRYIFIKEPITCV